MSPSPPISRPLVRFDRILGASHAWVGAICLAMIALIALTDFFTGPDISLGVLYVLPVGLAATAFSRNTVLLGSLGCSILRTALVELNGPADGLFRGALSFVAYTATGYLIIQLTLNRRLMSDHLREVERQQALRRDAEDQLRALADGSPAAILTLDESGRVLSGNRAAHSLFGLAKDQPIEGVQAARMLPVLGAALDLDTQASFLRTAAQSQGRRANGDVFVAQTWFSTYRGDAGKRLAAIAVDCSEEVREREEQNLRQILDNNRIIAGAVSHEIRNVCAAVSTVYSNLRRLPSLPGNEDFEALGVLVATLERIAAVELQGKLRRDVGAVNVLDVLEHLSVVIEPSWEESGGAVTWNTPPSALLVRAEPFGLMQAFLNLSQNSLRAVQDQPEKRLTVEVAARGDRVSVVFADNGPGVRDPRRLFQPFQAGAESAGLGLYVSRAILRGYGGDLRHEPSADECRFVVELEAIRSHAQGAAA